MKLERGLLVSLATRLLDAIFFALQKKSKGMKKGYDILGFYYRFYNRVRTPARPPQGVSSYTFGQGRVLNFFFISIYMNGKSFIACGKRFDSSLFTFSHTRLNGWRQNSRAGHRQISSMASDFSSAENTF